MLLAGDVGGTKTLLGLFSPAASRPVPIERREYRTLDFDSLGAITRQFLRDTSTSPRDISAAAFGVAGPVSGSRATLTNVPWVVDVDALRQEMPIGRTHLVNDLEAMAWSVPVLAEDELETLQPGTVNPQGNAGVIAAGTGLGIATLTFVDGRLVPRASEGGHADFAARNADEQKLANGLTKEFGRADIERVVSGPGIANIHRVLFPHRCERLANGVTDDEMPAAISGAALEGKCDLCKETLRTFVSAYGAAAGNLALTILATGGIYLGGGIAPRIRPALRWPDFIESFLDKEPMRGLVAQMPVKIILNPAAGLLGAATYANHLGERSR